MKMENPEYKKFERYNAQLDNILGKMHEHYWVNQQSAKRGDTRAPYLGTNILEKQINLLLEIAQNVNESNIHDPLVQSSISKSDFVYKLYDLLEQYSSILHLTEKGKNDSMEHQEEYKLTFSGIFYDWWLPKLREKRKNKTN